MSETASDGDFGRNWRGNLLLLAADKKRRCNVWLHGGHFDLLMAEEVGGGKFVCFKHVSVILYIFWNDYLVVMNCGRFVIVCVHLNAEPSRKPVEIRWLLHWKVHFCLFVCWLIGRLTANDWFVNHQWSFKHEIITENEWNHFYALHHLVEIILKKAKNWISASNKLIKWFVNHQPPFDHEIITENEWNNFFRLISERCLIICFRWNDANYIN